MGVESLSSSLSLLALIPTKFKTPTAFKFLNSLKFSHSNRFFCNCSHQHQPEMAKYKESFSRRMSMAGLKPHHPIAMGVSGGPDSVALCVLAAHWKADAGIGIDQANGCIHGLLAVIVDHSLRPESSDEANAVSHRISKMGIRCEIARCDWSDGRPKQGHLQEMARDMRLNYSFLDYLVTVVCLDLLEWHLLLCCSPHTYIIVAKIHALVEFF